MTDYTESQLVLPALEAMSLRPNGYISTTDLIRVLEIAMGPTGPDAEILYGRRDTHFSQKVRNLKSNRRLKRYGWALYVEGGFIITDKGRAHVNRHIFGRVASGLARYADASGRIPRIQWTEQEEELVDRAEANLAARERQAAELDPKESALLGRHRSLLEELRSLSLLDSNPGD